MQSAITHLICLTVLVLAAIDLHYQPHFQAHEIRLPWLNTYSR
jgi:hypothetical protein